MQVLTIQGNEFGATIGYGALGELLYPILDRIDALPESLSRPLGVALGLSDGPPPGPLAVCNGALALAEAAGTDRPLLLVVDDLQWIDRASASVITFIGRRASARRIGLLASIRSDDADSSSGLPEHRIAPLDEPDASLMLQERQPTLSARERSVIVEQSAGIPLALRDLGMQLSADQPLDFAAPFDALPLTQRLESLYADRVVELPPRSRRALLRLALDGRTDSRATHRLRIEDDDLTPAREAGVIEAEVGGTLRFSHPLMRSAIVRSSSGEVVQSTHHTLAQLLSSDPERRAWHLAAAANGPDEVIASALENVARRALSRGDAGAAVTALSRAARLSTSEREASRRFAEAAFLGADVTGELALAQRLLERAHAQAPAMLPTLHAAAAASYVLVNGGGDVHTARALLVGAIENGDHSWRADDLGLTEALTTLLQLCSWAGRDDYWAHFYGLLDRVTPQVPEVLFIYSRTFPDTAHAGGVGRTRLVELIGEDGTDSDPIRATRLNTAAIYVDLLPGCRQSAWRMIEDGRAGGGVRSSVAAHMQLCLDDFAHGRFHEQRELASSALAMCRQHGYGFIEFYFLLHLALVAAIRGDIEEAHRLADELTAVTSARKADGSQRLANHPRVLAAAAAEDWESCFLHASALSPAGQLRRFAPHAMWVAFDLVESALKSGRAESAHDHVSAMITCGVAAVSPRMEMLTLASRGMVAPTLTEASELFEAATNVRGAQEWPFDFARVELAFGERLRREGTLERARQLILDARDIFLRLGAQPWVDRSSSELRPLGVTTPRAPSDHVDLSERERDIVRLAAQGLSNREIGAALFISPRTVGGYLYRVFPRLGVTKRSQLRDVVGTEARI